MAAVDTVPSIGTTYTLDALNEWTPFFDPGKASGIAQILLEFSADWNGTVTFKGVTKSDGAWSTPDPVTATNLNGAATATTSTGGASAVEQWRVDLAGGMGVTVEITTFVAGSVDVTIHITEG